MLLLSLCERKERRVHNGLSYGVLCLVYHVKRMNVMKCFGCFFRDFFVVFMFMSLCTRLINEKLLPIIRGTKNVPFLWDFIAAPCMLRVCSRHR